jgi:hypothetical protein
MKQEQDFAIPESVAVRVFNERTGASCTTIKETIEYLKKRPMGRKRLSNPLKQKPAK